MISARLAMAPMPASIKARMEATQAARSPRAGASTGAGSAEEACITGGSGAGSAATLLSATASSTSGAGGAGGGLGRGIAAAAASRMPMGLGWADSGMGNTVRHWLQRKGRAGSARRCSGTSKAVAQWGQGINMRPFSASLGFSARERLSPEHLPCKTGFMVRFGRVGLAYQTPRGNPGQQALHDISFALGEGSFTWLLGPSGAGKSSILRLMYAALRPTRGKVSVLGTDIGEADRAALPALRRKIGVVHQEFRLLPHLSAWDNVALPLRLANRGEAAIRQDVNEILAWLGLADKASRAPAELSGGEQQRIAIARAIISRPALLIADEPTSELDVFEARRLVALFVEMNRMGTAIVVATHSEDLPTRHPARVITLAEGRIVDAP